MNQSQKPKYVTLFYDTLHNLDISIAEYFLLEMVSRLSIKTGYCYKTAGAIGSDMRLTKQGVNYMIKRLCERGLLERLNHDAIRVTDKYFVEQDFVPTNNLSTDKKVTLPTNNLMGRQKSSPKNYIKNNNRKDGHLNNSENTESQTHNTNGKAYLALRAKMLEKRSIR